MACLTLPPKQRLWGMVLGAGVAVLLRVVFTLVIAPAMTYPFLVLVWGGGALLGWVAGDVMVTDPVLANWFSEPLLHQLHIWGGPVGGLIVMGLGYIIVGQHRRLILDEILAGVALVIWIIVDRISDSMFGGADPDLVKIWIVRFVLILAMTVAYALARKQW